jgi:hypothetical protein
MGDEKVIRFFDATTPNRAIITDGKNGVELFVAAFDPDNCSMATSPPPIKYKLVTFGTNDVVWQHERTQTPMVSESIAESAAEQAFSAAG